jgi:hypothetical protein
MATPYLGAPVRWVSKASSASGAIRRYRSGRSHFGSDGADHEERANQAGEPDGASWAAYSAALLDLRPFGDEHGLQDLIGNFLDRSGRVRQKQRIGLIAFSDGLKRIKILGD